MDNRRRSLIAGGVILGGAALSGVLPAMCSMARNKKAREMTPPQRPEGEPLPMLEEDIAPILARLDAWYAANLPAASYAFNPPASDEEIAAAEEAFGLTMPSAWRQLYRWHDGENDDRFGHIYGLPILPLVQVVYDWQVWKQVLADFGDPYAIPGTGWPEGAVDPAYANPGWIPLTSDFSGGHIGIDLAPWPKGRIGQIIVFGRDEDNKVVLAESLGGFLGWIADLLEAGNFRLGVAPGETVLREFRLKDPAVDSFTDGARILKGAPPAF